MWKLALSASCKFRQHTCGPQYRGSSIYMYRHLASTDPFRGFGHSPPMTLFSVVLVFNSGPPPRVTQKTFFFLFYSGSHKQFAWDDFKLWSSWCLPPETLHFRFEPPTPGLQRPLEIHDYNKFALGMYCSTQKSTCSLNMRSEWILLWRWGSRRPWPNLSIWNAEIWWDPEDKASRPAFPENLGDPTSKITMAKWTDGEAGGVEHLFCNS
jgi:hypothetical protein